jgi:hypothetical protein
MIEKGLTLALTGPNNPEPGPERFQVSLIDDFVCSARADHDWQLYSDTIDAIIENLQDYHYQ